MRGSLIYLIQLVTFVFIAVWLSQYPGWISIEWLDWKLETSCALFLLAISVIIALATFSWRVVYALIKIPSSLWHYRKVYRDKAGYHALIQGLAAVAVGDGGEAKRFSREAGSLLKDPYLTRLLSAQAAVLGGDLSVAGRYFATMRDNEDTAFFGLLGLMRLASARGDYPYVLELAKKANNLRPTSVKVATTMVFALARDGQWEEAQSALQDFVKRGLISKSSGKRHRAALLIERSRLADNQDLSLTFAAKARESQPDFVPAIIAEAWLLGAMGRKDKAYTLINKEWKQTPHPDLVTLMRILWKDDLAGSMLLCKIQAMVESLPEHAESLLAVAETALDNDFWGEARAQLSSLAPDDIGPRACMLWARLEEGEHGNLIKSRNWMQRASYALSDPAWTCISCGSVMPLWTIACNNCGAFETITWIRPPVIVFPPVLSSFPRNGMDSVRSFRWSTIQHIKPTKKLAW
ncbi:hemY family protein [Candidatus Endolissoclinum faulkneri L2]|uniref:HemY family protein n=1 Tax=Candidatus Endolissoclinum faulkneri L2 TaxID=1193729 RepID=K7YHR4_9PROT|nr:heme biosynthesis HemY N-terminal domain-containing protein [Candidatus Endolissoclinum faulkneri]AFX99130.1 hemY family protein [Candidatus Endolissoclinum faulkneri L2]